MTPEQKNAIIVAVGCDHCGAKPGEQCRRPSGSTSQWGLLHLTRRDAAFAAGAYVAR